MRRSLSRFSLVLALGVLAAACDDGNDTNNGSQDGGTNDSSVSDGSVSDGGQDAGVVCWVDSPSGGKCWSCALPSAPETDSLKFLNRCGNASSYSKFDNATRIPASTWVPGTPLPAVP